MTRPKGPSLKDRALATKTIARVRLPVETVGRCLAKYCRVVGELADGLCVEHWDSPQNV